MTLAHVHARARDDAAFAGALDAAARRWFGSDCAYPARYEPNAADFLSGGLCEAVLMAHVLQAAEFGAWWAGFAPPPQDDGWALAAAGRAGSRSDAKLVHADGLNLSRAWCLEALGRGAAGTSARVLRPDEMRTSPPRCPTSSSAISSPRTGW